MDDAKRSELLTKLEEQLKKLEVDVAELQELTKPIAPENAIGRISRMDAINNKSINDAARRTAEARLAAIKEAIQRNDDPEFGKCRKCKAEIQEGRLILMPESPFCIRCASR